MFINFFRSSSFNRWDFCENLYFAEYCCGITGPGNKAANLGTCFHKIMELVAILKKEFDAGKKYVDLEICGKTKTFGYDLAKIVDKVYDYYKELFSDQDWQSEEYGKIKTWVRKIQEYNNGQYYPANLKIIAAEPKYDFEIVKPWAQYSYIINGKKEEGFLRLKGSIDLVHEVMPGIYNIQDFKTGRFYDWNKDKDKTAESIQKDPQLKFYAYATSILYPKAKQIWATLFYVANEGAFTVCFDKSEIEQTELMIKNRFETIKNCQIPICNRSWKCKKFCHLGTTTFENTHVKPIQEFRNNQHNNRGEYMSKCDQMQFILEKKGIEKTIEEYKDPKFTLGHYQEPGGSK